MLQPARLEVRPRCRHECVQRPLTRQARRERRDGPAIGDVEVVGDDVAADRSLLDELGAARRRVDVRATGGCLCGAEAG